MRVLGLLAGLLLINVSCTLSDSSATKVSIDLGSQKVGSSSIQNIRFVAINIHYPDRPDPVVFTKDFNDNSSVTPADLVFELKDLDTSQNVLIQLLVMSKDTTNGGMDFVYGDAAMELKAGSNVANIQSSPLTSSNKTGVVAGRYLTSATSGPSGTLVGSFVPSGKPPMDVIKEEMFDGWFNAIVIEGSSALFNYRILETGEVLFAGVNVEHFDSLPTSPQVVKVAKPSAFREGESLPEGEETLFLGFFSATPGNLTGKQACYLNFAQAVSRNYTDAAHSTPLIYDPAGDATKVRVDSGGVGQTHAQLYANNSCPDDGNNLSLHPSLLGEGEGEVLGMRGPFRSIDPLKGHDGFTYSEFTGSAINLKWKYLHGITNNSLSGVRIFAREGHQNGGDDHDSSCEERANNKGMFVVDDVPFTTGTVDGSYSFTNGSLSAGNSGDWRFLVCPYKELGTERHYYEASAENHCRGNCQDLQNFGIGVNDDTVNTGNFAGISAGDMGGASVRVVGVTSGTDSTTLVKTSAAGHGSFDEGSEILLMVVGEDNNGCDAGGNDYNPGYFEFTKALYANNAGTNFLKIPKGTFADNLITGTNINDPPVAGTAFCYVQAVEVPHFRNLAITANLGTAPMLYDDNGGGVIAFRVNGTLTLGSDIDVNQMGFQKGAASGQNGAGQAGPVNLSDPTITGGDGNTAGHAGGGGGYGPGANGTASGGTGGNSFGSQERQGILISLGGGGGSGFDGSLNTTSGGHGAGAVFVIAKNIISSSATIKADGEAGGTNIVGGGGGGAGSINIFADSVSGTLNLSAIGGDGGAAGAGGAGGGGWIRHGFCSSGTVNGNNSGGTSTEATTDQLGNTDNNTNPHFCSN